MWLLEQSTSRTLMIGPYISTSGVTVTSNITPDVAILQDGASTSRNDTTAHAYIGDGWFTCPLNKTDMVTLGPAVIYDHTSSSYLQVWHEAQIVDSTSFPAVDVVSISGDTGAADNLELFFDGTGYNAANSTVGNVGDVTGDVAGDVQGDVLGNVNADVVGAVMLKTTIDALASQTSFTLASGTSFDNAYNDMVIVITDDVTSGKTAGIIDDWDGANKKVALKKDPGIFTITSGDTVKIYPLVSADVSRWDSVAVTNSSTTSRPQMDVDSWKNVSTANSATTSRPQVDVDSWKNVAAANSATTSRPQVDVDSWKNVAAANSATTSRPQVDVDSWKNVAAANSATTSRPMMDVDSWKDTDVTIASNTSLPEVDAKSISDTTSTADSVETNIPNLDAQVSAVFTTQMTESYAADGVAPTPAQALFAIQQMYQEFAVSGTSITVNKLDGSTKAMGFILDDASAPTSITRNS